VDFKYHKNDKPIHVIFKINQIDKEYMFSVLQKRLTIDCVYTIYIKVRYSIDRFYMAGSQFGFLYDDKDKIKDVCDTVIQRLDLYMDQYDLLDEDIVYIELTIKNKERILLSEFNLDEDKVKDKHIEKDSLINTKKSIKVPISVNEDSLGKPLNIKTSEGFITNIELSIDKKDVNFLDSIMEKNKYIRDNHPDRITSFDDKYKFYLINDKSTGLYVLAIKIRADNTIDKIRYSLSGNMITRVTDVLHNGFIKRISGERTVIIKQGNIIRTEQNIKLIALPKPKNTTAIFEDKNIGVIDIETYKDDEDTGDVKIHALGFKTLLDKEPMMYYIDKDDMNSSKLVFTLLNELFKSKYRNIRFYCHNLGGYDIVFILKTIFLYNESLDEDENKYKVSLTLRNNKILKCVITKNKNKLVLIDSYPILPNKLIDICKDYEVETIKGVFPHEFSLKHNLFYVGNTPDIQYYKNIETEDYNELFKVN
jgi:hypothetical protein